MASFTDNIPQFNPYVQQLPVEAMVSVGMEKQKRYDEGLQKIQSHVDNIAGMDIYQPAQRAYLESKLNELGSNLKSFAASDFSNFQLVNSVGGMVNQIGKDKTVINAVTSTKAYRKGIEEMEAARKEGKSSPSNDWEFKNRANEWLSGDVNATFSGGYSPYTNYKKNALEVIKSLTKNKNITDDAFTFDKNGNMVIKDAILRTELAGISPEQVQQALLVSLTPADWKQMEIDGRYNYSNIDGTTFVKSLTSSYQDKLKSFADQRIVLENAKSSTMSAIEKEKLDNKIAQIDKILDSVKSEYQGALSSAESGDIEGAKTKLFTSNFMNGFARAFSFTETSQTYQTSPFVQNEQWRLGKEQDWKKFTLEHSVALENLKIRKEELKEKKEENRIARMATEGYGGLPGPVDPKTVPSIVLDNVVAQTNGYLEGVKKSDTDFAKSQGKDETWLNQQREAYLKSPNGVDPLVKQHFDNTQTSRRLAEENIIMVTQINSEADRRFGNVYQNIPKNAPNVVYRNQNNTVTFTPREFVDFNAKVDRYRYLDASTKMMSSTGASYTTKYNDELAKKELSPKEYILYEASKRGVQSTGGDRVLWENLSNYNKVVNAPYNEIIRKKNDFVAQEVKNRVVASQGVSYSIPTISKPQKESLANMFGKLADMAESQKGELAKSPGLDVSILRKISQSGDAEGSITVIEGTEFTPKMYQVTARGKDGTTTFNLTPEQKFAVFGDRFEPSQAAMAFRPYQSMMKKFAGIDPETNMPSQYMSTNPEKGPITFQNSKLNSGDFPNIKSYGVTGAVVSNDGGNSYSLRLNFYNPITKKYYNDIPYPRILNEEEVANAMLGITDSWVYETLNDGKQASKNDLQTLQKASKKPL
jgi:hypothetical protein